MTTLNLRTAFGLLMDFFRHTGCLPMAHHVTRQPEVPTVNAQKMVTSAEDFTNQIYQITHSVDTSQPFSTLLHALWAHEQSDHGGRYGDFAWM